MPSLNYQPQLPPYESVKLPAQILPEIESLASHVHDLWASKRIQEGWTYGAVQDGKTKQTPNLVPFPELPESEQAIDREVVLLILKLLYHHGYKIVKPETKEV